MRVKNETWAAAGLLSLRIGLGSMMFGAHGWGKLTSFSERLDTFPDPLGLGSPTSLVLIVFAEVVCALLVIAGGATRFASATLLIAMLTAGFVQHAADPFARKEMALVYAVGFLALCLTGAGAWSLDAWLGPRVRAWWSARRSGQGK